MFHNCDFLIFPFQRITGEFETETTGTKTTICSLSILCSDCLLSLTSLSPENVSYKILQVIN